MRDSFEPLIPLNGCKGKHFPVNNQIFTQKSFDFYIFLLYNALTLPS